MIHSLRKRHAQIWIALAILLPILFIAGISVAPPNEASHYGKKIPANTPEGSYTSAYVQIVPESSDGTSPSLILYLLKPLPAIAPALYIGNGIVENFNKEDFRYLGNVTRDTEQQFKWNEDIGIGHIYVVYDVVKEQVLDYGKLTTNGR